MYVVRFTKGVGHYTQVVWADSEELGCGLVQYKNPDGDMFFTIVVCNYATAGNMVRGQIYEKGAACSACPPGYTCDDGLCAGTNTTQTTREQGSKF